MKIIKIAGILALFSLSTVQAQLVGNTPGQMSVGQSGAASYLIPIQTPPGTAGVQPQLSLNYHSQSSNGLLGIGWSLGGLSRINRCPATLEQDGFIDGVDFDGNDKFCLDGQRLLAVSGSYGANGTEYRTELDSFSKIISYGTVGSGPAWFKVWTKAGQVMQYGYTASSRIEAQGKSDVRVWAVDMVSDTVGNYYIVSYVEDQTNGDYYPDRIDYTGNVAQSLTPYNSVQFTYAARSDIEQGYIGGSITKTTKRLTHVKIINSPTKMWAVITSHA